MSADSDVHVCVAAANPAVIAIIFAVIGKFNQSTDVETYARRTGSVHGVIFKEICGKFRCASVQQLYPLGSMRYVPVPVGQSGIKIWIHQVDSFLKKCFYIFYYSTPDFKHRGLLFHV